MPSGKPMGGYWLDFVDSLADGVELTRLYSENNGQTWRVADPLDLIEPRKLTAFGEWIIGPANVLPIQNLNVSFLSVRSSTRAEPYCRPTKKSPSTVPPPSNCATCKPHKDLCP